MSTQVAAKTRLETYMYSLTKELQDIADSYYEEGKYDEAVSYYSDALLSLYQTILPEIESMDKISQFAMVQFNVYCSVLKNNRAECYMKLKYYDESLSDLNWIINKSKNEYGPKQNWIIDMLPHYKRASFQRADILLNLGNTGMSLTDCVDCLGTFDYEKHDDNASFIHLYHKLQALRHPSPQILINIKYNKWIRKLNKISIDGWIELKTKNNLKTLPFKQGHLMIVYKNKIYCFGGSSAEYGNERCYNDNIFFYEISIHETHGIEDNYYYYDWKKLSFPNKFKYKIIDKNKLYHDWSRLVTIVKWKGRLLIIGGEINPFKNILSFSFSDRKWSIFPTKNIDFAICSEFNLHNHSAVILSDKLYVFGGGDYGNNLLFCLDLKNKIWSKLCGTDDDKIINKELPPQRYDHIMWSDKNKGESGCIYIGFGSYFRGDLHAMSYSCCRRKIWRFDIAKNKWYKQSISGNFPARRAESGYTSIKRGNNKYSGIIMFGGYSSTLPSLYSMNETNRDKPFLMQAAYFGDCFEFLGKTGKWRMIHSKTFPSHRALPAMCIFKKFIVVYGGYHAGINHGDMGKVFNDLWILNKNEWERKHIMKYCKTCNKSLNECILYLCKQCKNTVYCSRKCQKKHWLNHKAKCSTFL